MSNEHLNYEQMGLTHGQINSLTSHKETRKLLAHLVDNSPTPVIAHSGKNNHIKLYFKGDGLVTMAATPSDPRSNTNADLQIRRSLASNGFEYQTLSSFSKKKKKKESNEETVVEPEPPQ
jgi:hypothetical protein